MYDVCYLRVSYANNHQKSTEDKAYEVEDDIVMVIQCAEIMNFFEVEMLHYPGSITGKELQYNQSPKCKCFNYRDGNAAQLCKLCHVISVEFRSRSGLYCHLTSQSSQH